MAGGSPDGETRLALTELAIAGEPGMSVSRIELDRPGPSYTVDTLRALRESYGQDELFLLMGTDMFLSFFQWREPEAIAKLATPVCMARDYRGLPFEDLRRVSLSLHKEKRRAHTQGVSDTAVQLAQKYGADAQLAARAGILHDVTKALTPGEQQALIGRWQLPTP